MTELKGVFTAIITPFTPDGEIDYDYLSRHLQFQQASGVDGVVACGTTGEQPSLTVAERRQVLDAVSENRGRLRLIAGTGCCSTDETVELIRFAQQMAADAALVVPPYYFKPVSAQGLAAHYRAVLEAVDLPLVLYNIPVFTGVEITDELVTELSAYAHLAGIKDSSGDLQRTTDYVRNFPNLRVFCGSDHHLAGALRTGAAGGISAVGNAFPNEVAAIYRTFSTGGDLDAAQEPVARGREIVGQYAMPAALKAALELMGRGQCSVRPPLVDLTASQKADLARQLRETGLLS